MLFVLFVIISVIIYTVEDTLPVCLYQRECSLPGLNEVFTWGDNANYTLGHKNIQRKFIVPELVSILCKLPISVQQVGACAY